MIHDSICCTLNNKRFCIYLLFVCIATIIGLSFIMTKENSCFFASIIWVLINIIYLLMIFNFQNVIEKFNSIHLYYIMIFIFIFIIILQLVWASEVGRKNENNLNIPVFMIIIISVGICALSFYHNECSAFIYSLIYISIWFYIVFKYCVN